MYYILVREHARAQTSLCILQVVDTLPIYFLKLDKPRTTPIPHLHPSTFSGDGGHSGYTDWLPDSPPRGQSHHRYNLVKRSIHQGLSTRCQKSGFSQLTL